MNDGSLEGRLWEIASEADLLTGLEQAFDYRGDVTIETKDGRTIEGYVFDRRTASTLDASLVRVLPKESGAARLTVRYSEIAALRFTGRDTAAGKSWEAWVKKYFEKRAAGERNIALRPEALEDE